MKNFPLYHNGKAYWVSRSVAVVVIIVKTDENGETYVLVETRGKGAADFQGKKCFVCGYLDYDETLEQAACREAFEETGIVLDEKKLEFIQVNSQPNENLQNVSVQYMYFCKGGEDFDLTRAVGGEKGEVAKVEWLNVRDIKADEFCFGHDKLIEPPMTN